MSTYTTVAGDTWDVVAQRALGSEGFMPDVIAANTEHIWTIRFGANVELTIPTVSTETPSTLPPWRT